MKAVKSVEKVPAKKKATLKKKVLLETSADILEVTENDVTNIKILDSVANKEKMLSSELIPSLLNNMWVKKSKNMEVYTGDLHDEYVIDKHIFLLDDEDDLQKYDQVDNVYYDIYKIYKVYDNEKCSYEYTKNTIYNKLCRNEIFEKQKPIDKKHDKFTMFKNIDDVRIKILSIVRVKAGEKVRKEIDDEKDECVKKDNIGITNNTIKKLTEKKQNNILKFEEYEKYLLSLLEGENLKGQLYYVVKIYFEGTTKCYIYGSYLKPSNNNVKMQLFDNCIDEKYNKYEILKEINIKVELHGLLYVDEEIVNNDTINNGFNTFFHVVDTFGKYVNENIFMKVQSALLQQKYLNIDVGNQAYVAMANIGEYQYIYGSDDKNIVKHLLKCYFKIDLSIEQKNKNKDKFIELLMTTKAKDINIKLLKRNINIEDLDESVYFYKSVNVNKDNLLNYYDKNIELQTELRTSVKNLEGKFYSMVKFKKY